jgi:hypothetical protein
MYPVTDKRLTWGFVILSLVIFIIIFLRAYLVPMNHDESATFFYYIQSGEYVPFYSHMDANNHVLNSALSNFSFKIFGSSPLAVRLPSIFSFVFLVWAVARIQRHLRTNVAKLTLVVCFILAFHWISFYSVTRGYGMSMSFFVLSIAFLLDYFKSKKNIFFFGFIFSLQLAISANLTLLVPLLFLTGMMMLFQLIHRKLFQPWVILSYLVHFFILVGWIRFITVMQEGNALYYGQGNSYWEVTFKTLIELLSGIEEHPLNTVIAVLVISGIFASVFLITKKRIKLKEILFDELFLFTFMLVSLIAGFFILHHWKDVNYLEDRTALLFYPIAILMIVFMMDNLGGKKWITVFYLIPFLVIIQFFFTLNFRIQMMREYETFPERFYTTLLEEQEKSDERITIGGHRLIELMFAMMNYNHDGKLNLADGGEEMNPYFDYGIARKQDMERLSAFYEVIDEAEWDYVLLKRKNKAEKRLLTSVTDTNWREGENEFFEYLRWNDTIFPNENPLLLEFDFDVDHAAQPFNGWLVLDITDSEGNKSSYLRIPMNWVHFSWNGTKENKFSLVSGEMPERIQSIIVYLWNQNKQFIRIRMNEIRISQFTKSH